VTVHRTIVGGKLAVELADPAKSKEAIGKAIQLLDQLNKILKEYGIKLL